jgi:Tol biopolymer transport system component
MRRLTFFIWILFLLASCAPATSPDLAPATPQLVFLGAGTAGRFQLSAQADLFSKAAFLPFHLSSNCTIYNLYPNPVGAVLAVEYECDGGPAVAFYNVASGKNVNPGGAEQLAARFLAWSADGHFLYLKADTISNPTVIRIDYTRNSTTTLNLPAGVYDLAALPDGQIVFSTTQGIGFGSEVWLSGADGQGVKQILSQPLDIVAYLQPSPDGKRIAFIRFPDTQTPYPNGELWLMDTNGKNARRLADADAGHGYAPAWSPDGKQIAFVVRENPNDPQANQSAGALLSNVYRIEIASGIKKAVTNFPDAIVEAPVWSPDGTSLVFNVARNDTIQIWFDRAGVLQPLNGAASCCAAWTPGK